MEENSKKIFSTLLLAVGVLFIVVSGGIFVSQTWQYLPDAVKKLCLVAVTAAFFGGSLWTEKKGLGKAATALYYLGVCFTGFSVTGLLLMTEMEKSSMILLALASMSVPMVIRFWKERRIVDLILQVLLCDGMILCLADCFDLDIGGASLLATTVLSAMMAGLIVYCRRELTNAQDIIATAAVVYVIHTMISLPWTLIEIIFGHSFVCIVVPAFLILGSVTVLYLSCNKHVFLRIVQSFLSLYAGLAFFVGVFKQSIPEYDWTEFSFSVFGAFLLGLILMIWLDRRELLLANVALTGFYSMVQMGEFMIHGADRDGVMCFPYGIAMALALVAWKYFTNADISWKKIARFAILFGCVGLNGLAAYFSPTFASDYGMLFLMALGLFILSFITDDFRRLEGLKGLLQSMSLLMALIALLTKPIFPVVFHSADGMSVIANFEMEYICIFLGVGIVLLGIIWYDMFEEIRIVQLAGTCMLLATLLFHNLMNPALPNVLFLGLAALLMLVLATLFKKKAYALASAITLTIIVLYLTREVWLSIAWWVYLFVAGVGLVIFAIKKEKAEK